MNDLHDQLSRLHDGELAPEEAKALRARIATEPAVERAWQVVQRLGADLARLPDAAPPAGLDARVLAAAGAPAPALGTSRRTPWVWGLGLALAVAAAALLFVRPRAQMQLVDGSQWVQGHARVHAAAAWVDVDGQAMISVEPRGGAVRVPAQEDPMRVTSHLVAAVAGAAVTVAVYEGVAHIRGPEGQDVVVHAGERRTVGEGPQKPAAAPATPSAPVVLHSPAPDPDAPGADEADPQARIAALEAEVARLKVEKGFIHGQLAEERGEPQPWPDHLAPLYEPKEYTQRVEDALATTHLGDLVKMDCSEYPCIAYVDVDPNLDPTAMQTAMSSVVDQVSGDEDPDAMQLIMKAQGDNGETALMAMAVYPKEAGDDVQKRARFRAQAYAEDYAHDADVGQ